MRCFFPWLGIFLLLFPQTVLAQQESIVSYRSTIQIEKSSDLVVTENIIVNAQGTSIQHGIYRDFPVRYRDQHGVSYRVPFETISILKNGIPEPYHIEKNGAYERIYIGSRDFNLAPGQYLYTLVFRTSRQVGYFPDHDELYFNAVGTGWDFPIGRAEVEVILPPGVPRNSVKAYAYTGPEGSRARDYWTAVTPSGNLRFTSSRPFEPHEGITVVIEWPKGFVHEPTAAERRQYFIADNWHVLIASGGLIILLVYFIFAWETAGKDPPKGTVIPLYAPPNGFSPAACRYLQTMSFDNPGFASAILGLAVTKGIYASQSQESRRQKRASTRGIRHSSGAFFPATDIERNSILHFRAICRGLRRSR